MGNIHRPIGLDFEKSFSLYIYFWNIYIIYILEAEEKINADHFFSTYAQKEFLIL